MIIVSDSSALISLATCSALPLLTSLYDDVFVPEAVYIEVTESNKPQSAVLKKFLEKRIVKANTSQNIQVTENLGKGELEAMRLYKQLNADSLLIDDRRAKQVAEANNIDCIGALGVLLLAKHQGFIDSIKPYIAELRTSSIYYSDTLLQRVLELASEN